MKKILFSAVSALAVAGMALAAVDSTQFGILRVPSSAKQTIVNVPWLETGTGTSGVTVSNFVLTAELEEGDLLKYYNGSSYEIWRLGKVGDEKYWQSTQLASDSNTGNSEDPATKQISRGKAILLDRCGGDPSRVLTGGFCIMGKPAASESGSLTINGTGYSLIAPSTTTSKKIGELTWEGLESLKEHLLLDVDGTRYNLTWVVNEGWLDNDEKPAEDIDIPAGQGMWFWSSSTGAKTVQW